ncbi:MAG: hypothetical protein V9E92_07330 [Methylotenera sp.]
MTMPGPGCSMGGNAACAALAPGNQVQRPNGRPSSVLALCGRQWAQLPHARQAQVAAAQGFPQSAPEVADQGIGKMQLLLARV